MLWQSGQGKWPFGDTHKTGVKERKGSGHALALGKVHRLFLKGNYMKQKPFGRKKSMGENGNEEVLRRALHI